MNHPREVLRFRGLCCGMAPIYFDMFQDSEEEPVIFAMVARPNTYWLLSITTWMWDTVATIAGKQDFINKYSIRPTGHNPYYIEEGYEDEDS